MADENKMDRLRREYAEKTDDDLLYIMRQYVPHSEMHIAAEQERLRRQRKAQEQAEKEAESRHIAALKQERELHRQTQRVAWYAFWASIVGVVIATAAFIHDLQIETRHP